MGRGSVRNSTLVLPDRICYGGLIWQDGILTEIFEEGTTAILPTTMSCVPSQLKSVIQNVVNFQQYQGRGAEILGLHMEGPFLAPEFRGAQATEMIWDGAKDGSVQFLASLLREFPSLIKILTFAPERPDGRELAEVCLAHGVIPSVGHTSTDFDQMEQAVQWGIRHITHAFNAMPGIHHRHPGLLTKALLDATVTMEIIADGVHIHPAVIELVLKIKPPAGVCLISDGTRAVGMPDGEYDLGGQKTIVRQGMAQLPDGTIAGSAYPLLHGLKMLVQKLQYPLPEAVRYATSNPAKLLGIDHRVGSLEIYKEATFIRLSSEFDLKQVWLQGRLVYDARGILEVVKWN